MTDSVRRRSLQVWLFCAAVLVVAADIGTKQIAITQWADQPVELLGGVVVLTESRNPGAAFGIASGATPALTILAAVTVAVIVALSGRAKTKATAIAGGLLLGGVAGNLIDRLFRPPGVMRGYVVDWIDIGAWPNFNLADSALTAVMVLIVGRLIFATPDEPTPTA